MNVQEAKENRTVELGQSCGDTWGRLRSYSHDEGRQGHATRWRDAVYIHHVPGYRMQSDVGVTRHGVPSRYDLVYFVSDLQNEYVVNSVVST